MRALPQNMRDLAAKFKSDGLFSCDKNAQLALLVNDALRKAEQEMTKEVEECPKFQKTARE